MDYTISIIRVRRSEQRLGFADEKAYERKLAGLLDAKELGERREILQPRRAEQGDEQ